MATNVLTTESFQELRTETPRYGWVEAFVIIQFLNGVLLFIPGAQSVRFGIRALPYLSCIALFMLYGRRPISKLPASTDLIMAALFLLGLNLLHPSSNVIVGSAQVVFQFCIAAPIWWACKAVRQREHLKRILWLIFLANAASASVGLLQTYYPNYFMPPEFSTVSLSSGQVQSLTYTGASGQKIIRPPGLTDLPGGAAVSGMITGVLGLALAVRRTNRPLQGLMCLALSGIGVVVLYLTQVRSLLLMTVFAIIGLVLITFRQGRGNDSYKIAALGVGLVVLSFAWATAIGGKAISERFSVISDQGIINSYQTNRGLFVDNAINVLAFEYPMGAGIGRWGMMNAYFIGYETQPVQSIWVEIQMQGWLLDGGILMWFLYGGAIAAAMMFLYRVAVSHADNEMRYLAGLCFCFNLIIVGLSLAGPTFNTQLGIQFWFVAAAIHGVVIHDKKLTLKFSSR